MATKHCCYGTCRSDSTYVYAEDVFFIPFPKPYAKKCDAAIMQQVLKNAKVGFTLLTHANERDSKLPALKRIHIYAVPIILS